VLRFEHRSTKLVSFWAIPLWSWSSSLYFDSPILSSSTQKALSPYPTLHHQTALRLLYLPLDLAHQHLYFVAQILEMERNHQAQVHSTGSRCGTLPATRPHHRRITGRPTYRQHTTIIGIDLLEQYPTQMTMLYQSTQCTLSDRRRRGDQHQHITTLIAKI